MAGSRSHSAPPRAFLGVIGSVGLVASLILVVSATAERTRSAPAAACSPTMAILESPRAGSMEVQAKALNDRGDIVGFADTKNGSGPIHAILWKGGETREAVDLGVLPGYVASEAYGINNHRVIFGLLDDRNERTLPFRWVNGRITVLKGPSGRIETADIPDRNTINERGEMTATLIVNGNRRAVRWTPAGKATLLPALPGHTWTNAWSINDDGTVSGWSRKQPNDDGENNPVLWSASGKVIPLKTAPGRADGAAEATNHSGLTVGYLGNLGTDGIPGVANTDPERDNAIVWRSRTARPLRLGRPAPAHIIEGLIDVNDNGEAAGMSAPLTNTGFSLAAPRIWRTGWTTLKPLPIPPTSQRSPVVVTNLNDINNRGDIVGNVYGLTAEDYSKLRRVDPVLWTCPFGN